MKSNDSFETERLILKHTNLDDAAFLYELMNSPKWIQFIGDRNCHSIQEARRYILVKILPQYHKFGFSNYTVIRKSDNIKIGTCGLYDRDGLEGFDLGFAFLPAYEKQGYAYEAATKMLQLAFDKFHLETVCAITTKENFASQNLLKKLGMSQAGTATLPNDPNDLLLFETYKTSS